MIKLDEPTPFDSITVGDIADCIQKSLPREFRHLRHQHGQGTVTAKLVLEMEGQDPMTTVSRSIVLCVQKESR